MERWLAVGVLVGAAWLGTPSWAQSVGDIQEKGAKKLAKQELIELLPGSTQFSKTDAAGDRRVKHELDGTVSAYAMGSSFTQNRGFSGTGKWWVSDEGRYCFTIDWPRNTEKRCMVVYRLGDTYYGTGKPDDAQAGTLKFTLSK